MAQRTFFFAFVLGVVSLNLLLAQQKTTRDGVFTAAQATRGASLYFQRCTSCHMEDLSGGGTVGLEVAPPLQDKDFMKGRDLASVFTFLKTSMPADAPGVFSDINYVELIAFLLQQNDYPAGDVELKPDVPTLRTITVSK